MKWIKVKIEYYSDSLEMTKEKIIGILSEIGIKQIEVVDYFTENGLDYNVNFKSNSDVWSMTGYIINNRFSTSKLNIIRNELEKYSSDNEDFIYEMYIAECSDEDWQDEWKKYFHTVRISDKIIVKPSWEKYDSIGNEIVIEIDPGLAFGTGTHETTALCVDFLEKYCKGKEKLLDIGCGSGILMLIGKKLGVREVTGIDIDEKVKEVVLENFERNNIKDNFNIIIGNLVDKVEDKYDIVVSNILVDVLEELLESIEHTLQKDAVVIFSGILKGKEEQFLEKAGKYNLKMIDRNERNNWVSAVFQYTG